MHAACRIVTWGSCCTKRFAEFNGNCESYCSLEQLVASLCAAHEGKPASGTYHSKTEGYTRRNFYRPPGLLCCGECTWTRIIRQPVIVITWHFTQHTLLEPLTVTGASAFCFGERYRDVLSQNLDENNSTQTSPDCCTVCKQFSYSTGVCVCYIQFDGYTGVYVIPVCRYEESNSAVSPARRGAHKKTCGIRNRRRNVYASHEDVCGCFGSAA